MGKIIGGFLIGLIVGLVFSDTIFPDGFGRWVEQQAAGIQSRVPGR
jgi:hypothetical protein